MGAIKSIDTLYRGNYFRSRLEARWAVFFDIIKVRYEYEPQGFEMSNGDRYLPDFYFPDYGWYGEVKPDISECWDKEFPRWRRFCDEGRNKLLLLDGSPNVKSTYIIGEREVIDLKDGFPIVPFIDKVAPKYGKYWISACRYGSDGDLWHTEHPFSIAIVASQMHRFEHGG